MVLYEGVECYGELAENSNFVLVCEDEEDDGVWCDGLPKGVAYTWPNVVEYLTRAAPGQLVEVSAV